MRPLPSFLEGDKHALLLGAGCAFWCIFNIHFAFGIFLSLGGVPILFSYLSKGHRVGLISTLFATLIIFLFIPFRASANILLNIILPSSAIGCFALKKIVQNGKIWWYPESFLLNNIVIIFSIVLLIMSYTLHSEENVAKICGDVIKFVFSENTDLYLNVAMRKLQAIAKYFEGITAFFNMLGTVVNLQIAYALGKKIKSNIRPSFDTAHITISKGLAFFPIIAFIASQISSLLSYAFGGLFVVGLFAPTLSGLSIISFIAQKKKIKRVWGIITILFIVFPMYIVIFAAVLGLIDSFYPIRERILETSA